MEYKWIQCKEHGQVIICTSYRDIEYLVNQLLAQERCSWGECSFDLG